MTDMFAYPKQAEFNRVVPKTKIYAHAKPRHARQGTLRRRGRRDPLEIQARRRKRSTCRRGTASPRFRSLRSTLKTPELDEAVLQAMDKAIPFPAPLPGHSRRARSALPPPTNAPARRIRRRWVIEASFQTEPQPLDAERPPLPVALDLAGLYEQIVRRHIPLPPRAGEGIREHVARFKAIEAKEKERQQLEARLEQEKQFNRKVELNAALAFTLAGTRNDLNDNSEGTALWKNSNCTPPISPPRTSRNSLRCSRTASPRARDEKGKLDAGD